MKTILVPTDFSKNAFVAAEYACALASITNQKVQLLHVYIALYSGYGEGGNSVKQIKWAESESVKAMKELVDSLNKQFPEVDIEGECVKGFMIEVVADKLKKGGASLVVMGTKGVTNLTESLLGSTTYEVIKKSPVPVLVVPMDTPDFAFERIGFFTAYDDHELDALLALQQTVNLRPHLLMLHFCNEGEKAPDKELTRWERKVDAAYPDWSISYRTIPVEKTDINAVTQAAKSEALDLLVFARPQKSFFQNIFMPSLTKAVANYPSIPSLFISV
ncbi:Nucleotide-binding universal stress protein, UspA family [Parapedobacter composti]|uniref:Nucleotide-binding universal stress protein, UspA family n=1 Tax=Parapedobacter composti TaxID=623281 RepID=A0A1I1HBZ7_9SPHI|nr:universal stress protein [Parapedobacter composti]SFC21527.1 Nucleotide-binding universal stress protein, UspA family [Parapedobacter composti]